MNPPRMHCLDLGWFNFLESWKNKELHCLRVSQIEQGILHLINEEDPRITALMDCEGLSPFKFPVQMMRSFSTLIQDHYPDHLGTLSVICLPPLVQVIAQAFIQTVPAFLGGNCACSNCRRLLAANSLGGIQDTSKSHHHGNVSDDNAMVHSYPVADLPINNNSDHVLRAVIVVFLMLWIVIAFFVGMNDPESLSSQPS
ncbi:uncharacterized protein [Elaeis guineensis]|uniref:uncharacterized protein isoform X4 n=1 Tax=Elaeis guineensis var. tenera TaxID=51953 RepID=UPI003C6CE8A1